MMTDPPPLSEAPNDELPHFDFGHPMLFNEHHLATYRHYLLAGIALIERKLTDLERPFSGILPHELAPAFRAVDLNHKLDSLAATLDEVERLYLRDAVYFHHPCYMAHLNCPVVIPAILAELLLSSINSSMDTWDQSAGATLIEQKLIDWTADRLGLGPNADGVFTSGGTQSNLMSLLLARDHCCAHLPDHRKNKTHGLPKDFRQLRILASEASHFSVPKAAAILGLGYRARLPVACDAHYRMDLSALRRALTRCRAKGQIPMAVVATAGTTDFGSIDPLAEIGHLCREQGIWLHVDAAYGCGLLVSRRYRHWLDGIEWADSVTVDYHKSFFQPVSCGACFVRDRRAWTHLTYHADYLNPKSQTLEGIPNLVNKSLHTTRRFDALKLWLTLRCMGADALGQMFDQVIDLARAVYALLANDPDFETAHEPGLSTLVFRYRPSALLAEHALNEINQAIRQSLARWGEAIVGGTKVRGRQYLKFTLLNPTTTPAQIAEILALIKRHGAHHLQDAMATRDAGAP